MFQKYFVTQDLTQIRPEDVGYDQSSVPSNRASVGSNSRPHSGLENNAGMHNGPLTGTLGGHHHTALHSTSESDMVREDPLFNMLMTLQEAANTQTGDI